MEKLYSAEIRSGRSKDSKVATVEIPYFTELHEMIDRWVDSGVPEDEREEVFNLQVAKAIHTYVLYKAYFVSSKKDKTPFIDEVEASERVGKWLKPGERLSYRTDTGKGKGNMSKEVGYDEDTLVEAFQALVDNYRIKKVGQKADPYEVRAAELFIERKGIKPNPEQLAKLAAKLKKRDAELMDLM